MNSGYFRLGLFILVGLAVLAALVVAIGGSTLLREKVTLETYIDGSVQGLDVGSPVKYRGVQIGKVSEITFSFTEYQQNLPPAQRRTYVMVLAQVQPKLLGVRIDRRALQTQIERGLRMRLAMIGVTGTSFLELDYVDPKANPVLPIDWEPKHLYVPSAPGFVAEITTAAEEFARRMSRLDLEGLVGHLNAFVVTAQQKLDRLPAERASSEALALIGELRVTNRKLQGTIASLQRVVGDPAWKSVPRNVSSAASDAAVAAARLRRAADSGDLERTLAQLSRLSQRLDRLVAGQQEDVASIVANLRRASDNLRVLSEELRRNPSQILRSSPPPRIQP